MHLQCAKCAHTYYTAHLCYHGRHACTTNAQNVCAYAFNSQGKITCADCQATHPMLKETVQVLPPLSSSLLTDQPAQWPSCKEEVQLKNINKHMSSSCMLHTHVTIQHILQKPLDAPLTKLEERLGSNIVRRWIQESDTRLPTGGSVNTKMHIHI